MHTQALAVPSYCCRHQKNRFLIGSVMTPLLGVDLSMQNAFGVPALYCVYAILVAKAGVLQAEINEFKRQIT